MSTVVAGSNPARSNYADMTESADVGDLKSPVRKDVRVQVPLSALRRKADGNLGGVGIPVDHFGCLLSIPDGRVK